MRGSLLLSVGLCSTLALADPAPAGALPEPTAPVRTQRLKVPVWAGVLSGGLTLACGLAAGAFGLATADAGRRYQLLLSSAQPVPGSQVLALQRQGDTWAALTTVSFLAACAGVIATTVLGLVIDWGKRG